MRREVQPVVLGVGIHAAKQLRWRLHLVPANADTDDVTVLVTRRQFEDLLRFFHSKMPRGIKNPKQRYAEIPCPARASPLQSFEDGRKILLAEKADSHRDVDLGMEYALFLKLLHQPVGDELVILGAAQMRAHFLECR